jgi:hypothetical protein
LEALEHGRRITDISNQISGAPNWREEWKSEKVKMKESPITSLKINRGSNRWHESQRYRKAEQRQQGCR